MSADLELLRTHVSARLDDYVDELAELVSVDSGSRDVDGLAKAADLLAAHMGRVGLDVERVPVDDEGEPLGDVLVARGVGTGHGARRVVLVGHLDTVFPVGEAARRPFEVRDGRATGPGVTDDKGGVLAGLLALDAVLTCAPDRVGEVVLVVVPDEEIGSPGSSEVTRRIAEAADVVLCLECARENGDLVVARKGVADVVLTVRGRAAHAGIEPERGVNAAVQAAHLVTALHALNNCWPDVTVNVGRVTAGAHANVVPAGAEVVVDLRAAEPIHFEQALDAIRDLASYPALQGSQVDVRVVAPARPWPRSPQTDELLRTAQGVAERLGIDVAGAATGGAADANLLADLGVPILDGLGPIGGGDHSEDEWLDLSSVVPRVTLLAGLIADLATPPRPA